jgi:glutathione synthase/RimK-type ligase-like ATP-grasp enzyme
VTVDVVLVTYDGSLKVDDELPALQAALAGRGLRSEIARWDDRSYRWDQARLALIRSTWDYTQRYGEFLRWVARIESQTTLVNPAPVLRWNAHKRYLLELEGHGVPVPPLSLVIAGAGADRRRDALAKFGSQEVVIKPAVSGGARRTLRVRADSTKADRHLEDLCALGDALVQVFVPAVAERGEISLLYFDRQFSHAVVKTPAPGDFRVQEIHGGRVGAYQPTPGEMEVAEAALRQAPLPALYARVDLVPTERGPALMELELIEPQLFLPYHPDATARLVEAVVGALS